MRKFYVEVANDENWEKFHRIIRVKAITIKGAMMRAKHKMKYNEEIYQVCTRVKGHECMQPVWDFMNGNISHYFSLKL